MKTLPEVRQYIDSFSRPTGYNQYAWSVAKKMAMEVWDCYLNNRPFNKPINYFCKEFYQMLQSPEGKYIVSEHSFKHLS